LEYIYLNCPISYTSSSYYPFREAGSKTKEVILEVGPRTTRIPYYWF
jgi:hypothetical protein